MVFLKDGVLEQVEPDPEPTVKEVIDDVFQKVWDSASTTDTPSQIEVRDDVAEALGHRPPNRRRKRKAKGAIQVMWGKQKFYGDLLGRGDGCVILTTNSGNQTLLPLDRPVSIRFLDGVERGIDQASPPAESDDLNEQRRKRAVEEFKADRARELGGFWK